MLLKEVSAGFIW